MDRIFLKTFNCIWCPENLKVRLLGVMWFRELKSKNFKSVLWIEESGRKMFNSILCLRELEVRLRTHRISKFSQLSFSG